MVKRTAQALQTFGTELAETELPNNIQATSKLLQTHTSKRDRMKVGLLEQHTHTLTQDSVIVDVLLIVCVCVCVSG